MDPEYFLLEQIGLILQIPCYQKNEFAFYQL